MIVTIKRFKNWYKNWYKVIRIKAEKRRKCKANHYNCSECIHGDGLFEGSKFRGYTCRLEAMMRYYEVEK